VGNTEQPSGANSDERHIPVVWLFAAGLILLAIATLEMFMNKAVGAIVVI
jgi:hypothetical protein